MLQFGLPPTYSCCLSVKSAFYGSDWVCIISCFWKEYYLLLKKSSLLLQKVFFAFEKDIFCFWKKIFFAFEKNIFCFWKLCLLLEKIFFAFERDFFSVWKKMDMNIVCTVEAYMCQFVMLHLARTPMFLCSGWNKVTWLPDHCIPTKIHAKPAPG